MQAHEHGHDQNTQPAPIQRIRLKHRGQIVESDTAPAEGDEQGRANYEVELERLIADLGPYEVGKTRVEVCGVKETDDTPTSSTRASVEAMSDTGDSDTANTTTIAKARVEAQRKAAREAGFAPPRVFTETGLVAQASNAERVRARWEKQPAMSEQLSTVIKRIESEHRDDVDVCASDLRMHNDGDLTVAPDAGCYKNRPIGFESHAMLVREAPGEGLHPKPIKLTPQAFSGLCSRLGWGGGKYLAERCWPELRAINFNNQMLRLFENEIEAYTDKLREARERNVEIKFSRDRLTLRTRNAEHNGNGANPREVFAVVTPSYTAFDSDVVCEGVLKALPEGARGTVTYDGRLVRINAVFDSTIDPKHWAEGEVLRAGLQVKTNDTGGGSLIGSAFVWFNICCNMAIINKTGHEVFRIQHRSSVEEIARQYRYGLQRVLQQIGPFLQAWNYANDENVVERSAQTTTEDLTKLPARVVLAGLFNGLLEQRREYALVRGRRKDLVPTLVDACWADESYSGQQFRDHDRISRALLSNATTLVGHRRERVTPWDEDQYQIAGGSLLFGRREGSVPDPIPFVPFDAKGTRLADEHKSAGLLTS
jgi:hypothetical protein